MKAVILLALASLLSASHGFVATTGFAHPATITTSTTSLNVAGGLHNDNRKVGSAAQDRKGYWGDMPLKQQRDKQYRESPSVPAIKAVSPSDVRRMDDVMINEDYWLTWAMAMLGPLIIWYHPCECEYRGVGLGYCKFVLVIVSLTLPSFSPTPCLILTYWRSVRHRRVPLPHRGGRRTLSHSVRGPPVGPDAPRPDGL
jgi:hypothetical protein